MNRTWTVIIVIIAVILIGWWIYASREEEEVVTPGATTTVPTTTAPTTTVPGGTTSTSTLLSGPNGIYIVDQPPGNRVIASAVILESPGYVVIRQDLNGVAGVVLGSSRLLSAGGSGLVPVNMTTETVDGQRLIAELHTDNGNGTFNLSSDPVAQTARGQNASTRFTINSEAQLPRESLF